MISMKFLGTLCLNAWFSEHIDISLQLKSDKIKLMGDTVISQKDNDLWLWTSCYIRVIPI